MKFALLPLLNLLRLPVDFLFLTIDWLRGVFDTARRFISAKRGLRRSCTFCGSPEFVLKKERPCVAAAKYGNPWMFKAVCPCVRPAHPPEHATPYCTNKSAYRKPARVLPVSGLLIAVIWVGIVYAAIQLEPGLRFSEGLVALKHAEDTQHQKSLDTTLGKSDEASAQRELTHIKTILAEQHYAEAETRLAQLLERHPGFQDAYPVQADLQFRQLKQEEALLALGNAERAGLSGPIMDLLRAKKQALEGQPEQAVQTLDTTWPAVQPNPTILLDRAALYQHLNALPSARSNLVQLLELDPNHLKGRAKLSAVLFKLGETEAARAQFEQVQALDPADPDVRVLDLEISLLDGDLSTFKKKLKALSADFPDLASVQLRIARLEQQMRQMGTALERIEPFTRSPQRNERFTAHMLRAQIMLERDLPTDAERELAQALEIVPSHIPALLMKAQILIARQQWQAANKLLQPLANTYTQHVEIAIMQAACEEHLGELNRAEAILLEKKEAFPDNNRLIVNLGNFYQSHGAPEKAMAVMEAFLTRHPDDTVVINNLIYVMADQEQQLDRAHTLARQLMESHPNDPVFADTIGWLFVKRKAFTEAIPHLEMALRGVPNHPVVLYHLALAYHGAGNVEQARTCLERSLARGIRYDGITTAEQLLKSLQP